ncbi:hypothetical protein EV363DRAFT_1172427 [Boletus edulis]|uniref:Uncharacterized protein n=1 Tax=Boletus edulis BED1 TaxID=1328754 RepID=A0AAD4C061_BOLED|nr:hypothetical protein EV363DRAFT_1172427 [Boletus edulis]KAF8444073.1 hypothetical protein L210DRAFT_988055 [Boletus edulis BED1]
MSESPEIPTVKVSLPSGITLQSFSFIYDYEPDTPGPIRIQLTVQPPLHRREQTDDINDMYAATPIPNLPNQKENALFPGTSAPRVPFSTELLPYSSARQPDPVPLSGVMVNGSLLPAGSTVANQGSRDLRNSVKRQKRT